MLKLKTGMEYWTNTIEKKMHSSPPTVCRKPEKSLFSSMNGYMHMHSSAHGGPRAGVAGHC